MGLSGKFRCFESTLIPQFLMATQRSFGRKKQFPPFFHIATLVLHLQENFTTREHSFLYRKPISYHFQVESNILIEETLASYAAAALDNMCENFRLTESHSFSHFQMLVEMYLEETLAILRFLCEEICGALCGVLCGVLCGC